MGGITVLAMAAVFGVIALIVLGTLLLFFLGTGIPLLVLGIRRLRGHRSRGSKIAMIVLGIIFGLTLLISAVLALLLFAPTSSYS